MYAVPFQFRQMVERGGLDRRDVSSLREIVYAGEPFPPTSLAALMAVVPQAPRTQPDTPATV